MKTGTRRQFLTTTSAAAGWMIVPRHVLGGPGHIPPSEKTTLAGIGMGGQGMQNMLALQAFEEIQVVAVCDPNREGPGYLSWNWGNGKEMRLGGREPARRQMKGCNAYADYRELLEKEDVDAVMIATPDHTHAVITMAALNKGKHVYCEKPLAWSVEEARRVAETAKKMGVATQLGNHGQASEEDRVTREFILDGAIGPVHEVQVAIPPRFWPYPELQGRPADTPPVPDGLDWDLWLGPAGERPYHPLYHPWTWRNWWDFGTGQLGDLGCHKLSTVFKALDLKYPVSVEASSVMMYPELYPLGVLARFEFAARGAHPPLTLSWYDGGLEPPLPRDVSPRDRVHQTVYLGEKGTLLGHRIVPEENMKAYGRPPRVLERSPGHYAEWVHACRGGPAPGANFVDHAGVLTETCLLGNVALKAGRKFQWDGPNMSATDFKSANEYLKRDYRDGWSL